MKILLSTLLVGLFFFTGASKVKSQDIPKVPPIKSLILGNWNHYMDPDGCVILDSEYRLQLQILISFKDNNLSQYTALYYRTQFQNGPIEVYGPILASELVPYSNNSCDSYIYYKDLFNDVFAEQCTNDPNTMIPFTYSISLEDEFGNPYPVTQNSDLFSHCYPVGTATAPEVIPSTVYSGVKSLCCHSLNENQQARTRPSNLQTMAVPNPFQESLSVQFQATADSPTTIQLWNINGQMVEEIIAPTNGQGDQQTTILTDHLQAGIYFCKVKSKSQNQVFEVIKL